MIIILISANIQLAQEKDSTYKYWVTLGFWAGVDGPFNLNYSFSLGNNFYKVGYLKKGDTIFGGLGSNGFLFNSFDISIGRRIQSEWLQASLFAGPSFVFGEKRNLPGNNERFNTIGLETDIQLLFRPANEIGIGVYGNLNFIKNYGRININLILGNGK